MKDHSTLSSDNKHMWENTLLWLKNVVLQVRDSSSGKAYALKHMRLMGDSDAIADCMTEINALKALRQVPSVVSLR